MRILFAADGSEYTKKALAFLVTHEALADNMELVVINVQPPVPPRVTSMVGSSVVTRFHEEESEAVLAPIGVFLDRHGFAFRTVKAVGNAAHEILAAAENEKSHMIVLGTHGHGFMGRLVMGSVAQNVVQGATVPVLLVK